MHVQKVVPFHFRDLMIQNPETGYQIKDTNTYRIPLDSENLASQQTNFHKFAASNSPIHIGRPPTNVLSECKNAGQIQVR